MKRWLAIAVVVAVAALIPWPALSAPGDPPSDCIQLLVNGGEVYRSGPCDTAVTTTTQTATTTSTLPPATSTTVAATTTTLASTTTTTPATTTTVAATTTTTTPPSGTFADSFSAGLGGWSFAHWTPDSIGQTNLTGISTATIIGGEAVLDVGDQNYGDGSLRSKVRYDLTAGGEIRVMMRSNSDNAAQGSPWIQFTDRPYNAVSIAEQSSYNRAGPRDGVTIMLRNNCKVYWGPVFAYRYVNYVETVTEGTCVGYRPAGMQEMVYSNGVARFLIDGVEYGRVTVTIPTVGYLTIGVHNHASSKYDVGQGTMPSVTGWFDNVTYPRAAPTTAAFVTFTAYNINPVTTATVTVNGHAHTFTPHSNAAKNYAESVSIPTSDLLPAGNVVTVTGFGIVGNIELVIGG